MSHYYSSVQVTQSGRQLGTCSLGKGSPIRTEPNVRNNACTLGWVVFEFDLCVVGDFCAIT